MQIPRGLRPLVVTITECAAGEADHSWTTTAREDKTRRSRRELPAPGRPRHFARPYSDDQELCSIDPKLCDGRSGLWDQLPDFGEVVVIVFRDKVQMIDQAHGLLKARMQHGAAEESWLKLSNMIDQTKPGGAEVGQDFEQLPGIVIGFMGAAIAQIRGGKGVSTDEEIIDA